MERVLRLTPRLEQVWLSLVDNVHLSVFQVASSTSGWVFCRSAPSLMTLAQISLAYTSIRPVTLAAIKLI